MARNTSYEVMKRYQDKAYCRKTIRLREDDHKDAITLIDRVKENGGSINMFIVKCIEKEITNG